MELAEKRPNIEDCASGEESRRWYYLKSELVDFARTNKIQFNGGKFDIADRVAAVIDGLPIPTSRPRKKTSKFDWANERLGPETLITDNISFGPMSEDFSAVKLGQGLFATVISWTG